MAESVDALVSNTSRFTPVPVRPRLWVRKEGEDKTSPFFVQCVTHPLNPPPVRGTGLLVKIVHKIGAIFTYWSKIVHKWGTFAPFIISI